MSVFTDVDTNPESGEPHFVHLLAEQTVRQHPDAIAIEAQGQQITYRELDERTEVLCQAILHTDPDSLQIGISTTRTVEMVIGVMAILRAGKAYLPLDPAYPPQRLEQIISDSGMRSCLTTGRDKALFSSLPITLIESDQPPRYPDQLVPVQGSRAFVLYTSGSTGKPKGVCMGHAPLLNLLHWQIRESVAGFGTRTLQFSPLSFDPSFLEFLATFATGGTLVLITEEQRLDLDSLLVFIDEQRINRLFLPFVALQYLAEAAIRQQRFPHALQEVMTAGEQLKITPQVEQFFTALPDCVLFNQYGPTECHVVTQLRLEGHPSTWPRLPSIGKLIDNTTMYVVDEQLNVLPDGEVGELCFGGVCVAEGYLNRPDLTREKFIQLSVPGPAGPESVRIYRTGDLGRLLPDGVNVDFLGRRDDQVKIRGYRVELGEVEVVLNHCPGVKQAVVIAREGSNGQKRLLAYLIAAGVPDTPAVRQAVEQQLPDFMMPSAFVWLDDFPKTTSGKVDRKLLPDPDRKRPELGVAYRKPKTGLEQTMARIWSELLQIDAVGVDDNFFDLGGNSLQPQQGFDQTSDPGGLRQVAHVAFDGAQGAVLVVRLFAKRHGQPLDLDGIAERSSRAVCFDIADGSRCYAGIVERHADSARLPIGTGGRESGFSAPVVVDAYTPNQAVDCVAVAPGSLGFFQQYHAGPVAENGAPGIGVERAAVPVGAEHGPILIQVATPYRRRYAGTTGQGQFALPAPDALYGLCHRQQRRRTGRVNADGGAFQV